MANRWLLLFVPPAAVLGILYFAGIGEALSGLVALSLLFLILFGLSRIGPDRGIEGLSPGMRGQIVLWLAALFRRTPPAYEISHAWKEILNYQEGDRQLTFLCWNMSTSPYKLEFPSEKAWAKAAPQWARDRRSEILERLQQRSDLEVIIGDDAPVWGEQEK